MVPGHRPDVQDGGAGVSMGAGPAMEARASLNAPVLAARIYIDIYIYIYIYIYEICVCFDIYICISATVPSGAQGVFDAILVF